MVFDLDRDGPPLSEDGKQERRGSKVLPDIPSRSASSRARGYYE
jgi:hypothetical protein